jgi:hypothetical protein
MGYRQEKPQIEESYSLSIDELTAYIVTNCKDTNLSDDIVIATGFEYFQSTDENIFLIYPLEDIIDNKINVLNLDLSATCEICSNGIDKPMASIYKSDEDIDDLLNSNSEINRLPNHMKSYGFNICEECQSSIVTDLYYSLPDQYKLSYNI